jgi:hypothetical protein
LRNRACGHVTYHFQLYLLAYDAMHVSVRMKCVNGFVWILRQTQRCYQNFSNDMFVQYIY